MAPGEYGRTLEMLSVGLQTTVGKRVIIFLLVESCLQFLKHAASVECSKVEHNETRHGPWWSCSPQKCLPTGYDDLWWETHGRIIVMKAVHALSSLEKNYSASILLIWAYYSIKPKQLWTLTIYILSLPFSFSIFVKYCTGQIQGKGPERWSQSLPSNWVLIH